MKEFIMAAYHLFLFKPYTTYSRRSEVVMGIYAWLNILLAIIVLLK